MKIINFLKANIAHLVALCIFLAGLVLVIVSLFTPLFSVDYFSGGYVEAGVEVPLTYLRTDVIGFEYFFSNFSNWLSGGANYPYAMFIQICLMIAVCLAISIVCFLVSFIISLFKENISKKGEFAGAAFGITSAIIGFAVIMLLLIILTTTKVVSTKEFTFNKAVRGIQPGYILLIIAGALFIFSGAINTAAIGEKAENN